MTENQIATEVVDAALNVHRALGPGLLESVYEAALAFELRERGIQVQRQVPYRFAIAMSSSMKDSAPISSSKPR